MSDYLIDTHCHLHDSEWFTPDQSVEFLRSAAAANVRQVIVIGTDPIDSQHAHDFSSKHPDVFWTYGIHPEFASQPIDWPAVETFLCSLGSASDAKLVAIGEIGLDYHYDGYDRSQQLRLFERMLQLAVDLSLPVSLHIREAFTDAWSVLDNFPSLTGVVHSFTGNKRELKRALERGFYIGVNGLATYTTLALPPLENMLLETDAPFLTPEPFRGTINKPGYVREIATYLAGKLGVAEEIIVEQTTNNAKQLFQLRDTNLRSSASL